MEAIENEEKNFSIAGHHSTELMPSLPRVESEDMCLTFQKQITVCPAMRLMSLYIATLLNL